MPSKWVLPMKLARCKWVNSADFVVVPSNLLKMDVYKIKDIQPTVVYFQGKAVDLGKK